jgi:dephospho-CoA kinase
VAPSVVLTGGIGSGKSTVARMLEGLGAAVVDADAIVHELEAPGTPLVAEIAAAFPGVVDAAGVLDREALGRRVFADAAARARLNAIVHPAVGAEMARRVARAHASGAPLVVLDVPLWFETRPTGPRPGDPPVIVVWVPEPVALERQMARDEREREEALRRLRAQLPLDEKRRRADHVIDNQGTLAETRTQVEKLFAELTGATCAAAPKGRAAC